MLKHLVVIFGAAALGCAALQGLGGAAGVKPPEVKLERVTYRAADFEALHCDVVFSVVNPNQIGGRLEGYDMKLVVDGLTVAEGKVEQALDLGPGKTSELIIPAVVKWTEIGDRITSKPSIPADLPWKLSGAAHVKVGDTPVALPLEVEGALPVLRPPSIMLVALRITKASLTSVSVALDLEMRGTGGHPMSLGELTHEVELGGQRVLSGALAAPGELAGPSMRTLNVEISTLQAGLALMKTLQGDHPVDVHYRGHTSVDTGFGLVPFSVDTSAKLGAR